MCTTANSVLVLTDTLILQLIQEMHSLLLEIPGFIVLLIQIVGQEYQVFIILFLYALHELFINSK